MSIMCIFPIIMQTLQVREIRLYIIHNCQIITGVNGNLYGSTYRNFNIIFMNHNVFTCTYINAVYIRVDIIVYYSMQLVLS